MHYILNIDEFSTEITEIEKHLNNFTIH